MAESGFVLDGVPAGDYEPPTTGIHSQDGTTENDVLLFDAANEGAINRATRLVIVLDLVNLTQDVTIRVYEKIDGTNYRSVDPEKNWVTADEDGVRIDFVAQADVKITMQSAIDEAAARDVPWSYVRRDAA